MAVIEAISSKASLKTIINYITQDKKANKELITGKDCLAESCLDEMLYVKNLYQKNNGRQYIHIIQSFSPKDNLTAKQVHQAGLDLAEKFNKYQVLVATHTDKEHLHNHLIINSVSFENGYKIQMSKKDLQDLKRYSDEICLQIGASVIPKKENANYIKRNEYRVAERGKSWKFKLINAIDLSLAESNTKQEFIKQMNKLGYQINWTDTRKYITYTTPEGYKCRDNKLFDEKYLKGEMENKFRGIKTEQQNHARGSSSSFNSENELLFDRARNSSRFVQKNSRNKSNYNTDKRICERYTRKINGKEFRDEQEYRNKIKRTNLSNETRTNCYREIAKENNFKTTNKSRNNNIFDRIIDISSVFSNTQIKRPVRTIRSYRSLSKQAKKEYMKKKANSSSFNWNEEEEL